MPWFSLSASLNQGEIVMLQRKVLESLRFIKEVDATLARENLAALPELARERQKHAKFVKHALAAIRSGVESKNYNKAIVNLQRTGRTTSLTHLLMR